MNSQKYVELLEDDFGPWRQKDHPYYVLLQQDNASPHTAKATKDHFINAGYDVITWPTRSLDLNPIETFWAWLVREVYKAGHQYDSV